MQMTDNESYPDINLKTVGTILQTIWIHSKRQFVHYAMLLESEVHFHSQLVFHKKWFHVLCEIITHTHGMNLFCPGLSPKSPFSISQKYSLSKQQWTEGLKNINLFQDTHTDQ